MKNISSTMERIIDDMRTATRMNHPSIGQAIRHFRETTDVQGHLADEIWRAEVEARSIAETAHLCHPDLLGATIPASIAEQIGALAMPCTDIASILSNGISPELLVSAGLADTITSASGYASTADDMLKAQGRLDSHAIADPAYRFLTHDFQRNGIARGLAAGDWSNFDHLAIAYADAALDGLQHTLRELDLFGSHSWHVLAEARSSIADWQIVQDWAIDEDVEYWRENDIDEEVENVAVSAPVPDAEEQIAIATTISFLYQDLPKRVRTLALKKASLAGDEPVSRHPWKHEHHHLGRIFEHLAPHRPELAFELILIYQKGWDAYDLYITAQAGKTRSGEEESQPEDIHLISQPLIRLLEILDEVENLPWWQ